MKKQLFILLSLIALLVTAQVPQRFNKVIVTGDIVSPKFIRTGSTSDSVLLGNGSVRSVNSIKTDTSSLSRRINLKQDTLPFPEVRTGDTFLNDLGTFSAPPSSGGGSASGTPVYFWPTNSPTSGYLELDYTPYSSVVENTYSIPVGTTLLSSHLTDLQIAATTIDAGNWYISSRSKVNNLSGTTKLHVDFFLYHLDGTKTVLFGGDSEIFSTTDYKVYAGQLPESSFPCVATDRIGVDVSAINSGGSTKTLTTSLGAGIATFFSTPLRIRHSNLRDKNGEAAFQHLTSEQVSIVNATSGTNTGDETKTTIQNKLGAASYTNSGYLTSTEWGEFKGKVTFPGFGTTHTTAAYGDHLHTGIYEVPLTFSTGLTRTGNTITNNITQYTDAMARSAQLTANSTTTGLLTSADWNTFNGKQPAGNYAPASGSGNYVQVQNNSAQSGNMWLAGDIKGGQLQSTVATGTAPLTVNSTTMVSNLNAQYFENQSKSDFLLLSQNSLTPRNGNFAIGNYNSRNFIQSHYGAPLDINPLGNIVTINGYTSYHSGNLTNNLSTNYLPKWNGSSMVNSLISDDGTTTTLHSTTQSTSPITGALVTPGGIGVGGIYSSNNIITDANVNGDIANFNEFVKSGGTSGQFLKANGSVDATNYQPAITLTTTGTSGAATFSGGTLNVPNYSGNTDGGVYTANVSAVSGLSAISSSNSMYTSINGIITATSRIDYTYTGNTFTFLIRLPLASTTSNITATSSFSSTNSIASISYYSSTYALMTCFSGSQSGHLDISITYK